MIIKDSDRETHLERWLEIRRGGLTATEAGAIAAGKRTIGVVIVYGLVALCVVVWATEEDGA